VPADLGEENTDRHGGPAELPDESSTPRSSGPLRAG